MELNDYKKRDLHIHMELNDYKKRVLHIHEEQKRLRELEWSLHTAFAVSHEWNANKGKKVRIDAYGNGELSECGYLVEVEPCDEVVGCVVMHKVKQDGSEGERTFRVYFNHEKAKIEIEN